MKNKYQEDEDETRKNNTGWIEYTVKAGQSMEKTKEEIILKINI